MAVWGYGLLGPVEAHVNDRVIPLAGARQRLVLALLLLHANQLVPADRLIDELWGADLPQDPPGALRTQVSRLRRVLGPTGRSPSPKPSGWTNSGWWRGNGGPSWCCRWEHRATPSPPCR